jgi:cytoskeletal protein CcmA (bactofilin family)
MDGKSEIKTVIAEDVEVTGTIKCTSDIQIDGKLNGDLACSGNAVIGPSAVIKGTVAVDSISVRGQVHGNVTAKDRIELKSTAKINGDIKSKRLTVEDGVTFVGKAEVTPSGNVPSRPAGESQSPVQQASESADDSRGKGGLFGRK